MHVVEDLEIKDINVAVSAAISSYGRIMLWELMRDILKRGGSIYLCDTDSVCHNLDFSKHPDLLKKWIPDFDSDSPGSALGSLKCEMTAKLEKRGFLIEKLSLIHI